MEDNGKCIILKRKEYKDLRPMSVEIDLLFAEKYFMTTSIDLGKKLRKQIYRIRELIIADVIKKLDIIEIDGYKRISKMPYWERRKFLKQYE